MEPRYLRGITRAPARRGVPTPNVFNGSPHKSQLKPDFFEVGFAIPFLGRKAFGKPPNFPFERPSLLVTRFSTYLNYLYSNFIYLLTHGWPFNPILSPSNLFPQLALLTPYLGLLTPYLGLVTPSWAY